MSDRPQTLGEELYELIEKDQGDSFIGDVVGTWGERQVLTIAFNARVAHERAARKLRAFVKANIDRVNR